MSALRLMACVVGLLFLSPGMTSGQKNIVINGMLADNCEMFPVKMGSQKFNKIWNFRFGEYAVVSSKLGWTVTNTTGNWIGTKTKSNTSEKFSFVLCNQTSDSAKVNAANKIEVESMNPVELLPLVTLGTDELVNYGNLFTAYITINNDTTETWALFMNKSKDNQPGSNFKAYLTNGERKIEILQATSNITGGDKRTFPARGYEFIENNQSHGALQYQGSGALGYNKNIVWLGNNLDARMKLILASAMTAVLQLETTNLTRIEM